MLAVAQRNQLTAAHVKRESAMRRADAEVREQAYQGMVGALHDEVKGGELEALLAKEAVSQHNAAVGSTLREVKGALEQRKAEIASEKQQEARSVRNRVRDASMVAVPPEVAEAIRRSTGPRLLTAPPSKRR